MNESDESLLKFIRHYQSSLDKHTESKNDAKLLHYIDRLYKLPIKVYHLEQTGVGRTVNGLRKLGGKVGDSAKHLVAKWKSMVVGEQDSDEHEDDDDEDDDDDDEDDGEGDDGYSEEHVDSDNRFQSNEEENDRIIKKKLKESSSLSVVKNSEDRHKRSKHSSSHDTDNSSKHKKHHRHNGESSKSHKRRHTSDDDTDSQEERLKHKKKELRNSSPNDNHGDVDDDDRDKHRKESNHKIKKRNECDSEDESSSRGKKRESSSKKHKSERKSRELSEENEKISKQNIEDRTKPGSSGRKEKYHKEEGKRHESKRTKDKKETKPVEASKNKMNSAKNELRTPKPKVPRAVYGIDSGSGASFAEALGMCEPSSSKGSTKRKPSNSEKPPPKERAPKTDDSVAKLLKEAAAEPLDLHISSLLPSITPNYRPLGLPLTEHPMKKSQSDYEALSTIIHSKTQRTKVYSGNKTFYGKVPSLFEICIRILQDNIDALEYTGGVPYTILKPILEKATPNQLFTMEHHNPYLIEDTDELWQMHCSKDFKNKKREELESCREMYMRCLDEREAKLRALTANIKQAQDKSLPVRTTKLAYVNDVVKPPRNIARKQAKNGIGFEKRPSMTPSARLSSIAVSGEAGKVAVPNPGARAVERSSSHHAAIKPKKAPLMAKSLSLLKNRFRR